MTDSFIRPDVQQFLDLIAANPGPKMSALGPEEARALMRGMGEMFDLPAEDLAVTQNIAMPTPNGGTIPLRLFDDRPARAPGPALLFFHGGGFVLGDIDCYASACAKIARGLDMPVIAVDYRLAPEHPWPAAPDDCEAAARWVARNFASFGRTLTGLILAGDSAGGALALVTAMALRDRPADLPVLAQWLLYPVTDLARAYPSHDLFADGYLLEASELRWFWDCYAADAQDWRASPMVGTFAGLPPTALVTSGLDPLRDEGRAFGAAAIGAGVPVIFREARGMIHGFLNFRKIMPSAEDDLNECLTLLKTMIATAR